MTLSPRIGWLVLLLASAVAIVSAQPHIGGWNDASRLATVECLIDRHTLAIDDSTFLPLTKDKLWIAGHFYSDKSPVPALLMAVVYGGWQTLTGWSAAEWPAGFVYALTLASSGAAYVAAVCCVFQLGLTLGLRQGDTLWLTASFALATVAPVYARSVNNHVFLLAVAAALMLHLARLATTPPSTWLMLGIGTMAGLGYAIDLGAGPPLLLCTLALVAWRTRASRPVLLVGLGAMPWLFLNHAVNYATGGTFKPANAVPEYLAWPGSPFDAHNMTGMINHVGPLAFLRYAFDLLVGQRGFLGHNPALFLAAASLPLLLARPTRERPELLFAGCWAVGTWLLYALTSNNHSGICLTVRWFVPLLAPGTLILALCLRDLPRYRPDFFWLSAMGAVVSLAGWWRGPWQSVWLAVYWPVLALSLLGWLTIRLASMRYGRLLAPRRAPRYHQNALSSRTF